MTQSKKTGLYCLLTAALTAISWWLQAPITLDDPAPFLRALGAAAVTGVFLLAWGIVRRRGGDAHFLRAVGGVLLLCGVVLFVLYGGMEDTAAAGADTAMNLVLCLWTALPLVCLIRTAVLCGGAHRPALWIPVALLAVWLVVLFATGQLLHFVHLAAETA